MIAMMSFSEWVLSKKPTNTMSGVFLADSAVLARCGRLDRIQTWRQMKHLLHMRGADEEVRKIGRYIWRRFEMETQQQPPHRTAASKQRSEVIRSLRPQAATAAM
jgi:hypothetical protein